MKLSDPYPREDSFLFQFFLSLGVGVFVALFLILFQPFRISDIQLPNKIWIEAGFGLVSFMIMLVRYWLIPLLFPNYFDSRNWTLGKEILDLLLLVLIIAIGNYYYLVISTPASPFRPGFWTMILQTFLLGIFPVSGLVFGNYIYQLRKYTSLAGAIPFHTSIPVLEEKKPLVFLSENGQDRLEVMHSNLLYIEVKGNYVELVYSDAGCFFKKSLRNTLSRIQEQILESFRETHFIRQCHRSFLVNLMQVEAVSGNAQGYRFKIRYHTLEVPVGRKFKSVVSEWETMGV